MLHCSVAWSPWNQEPISRSVQLPWIRAMAFLQVSLFLDKLFPWKMTVIAWTFSQSAVSRMISISLCVNYALSPMKYTSRALNFFYVLQIFLWTASFGVNTEIVAWSTVRKILWRFLMCVGHAFFSMWRSCPGYVSGADLGGVQGVRTPPKMACGFLIQLVFCKIKKNYVVDWCWSRARDECTPS